MNIHTIKGDFSGSPFINFSLLMCRLVRLRGGRVCFFKTTKNTPATIQNHAPRKRGLYNRNLNERRK